MDKNYVVCGNCGTKVDKMMSVCVKCGNEIKKPFYKKGIFWVGFSLLASGVIKLIIDLGLIGIFVWLLSKHPR